MLLFVIKQGGNAICVQLHRTLEFAVPDLCCPFAHVEKQSCPTSGDKVTQLAMFVRGTLFLAASALSQVSIKVMFVSNEHHFKEHIHVVMCFILCYSATVMTLSFCHC